MACGSTHPEHPAVHCIATSRHADHIAFSGGQPFEWANEEYVPPAPKAMSRGKAAERLKALADQVPPPQRRVDENVLDIGATHPDTSVKMQARKIGKTGTQRRMIYDLALERQEVGITDDEIEQVLGLLHQSASAARNSLMKDGWLIDSGERRKTRSREDAIVWVARPGG